MADRFSVALFALLLSLPLAAQPLPASVRLLGGTGLNADDHRAVWTNPAGLSTLPTGQFCAAAGAEERFAGSNVRVASSGVGYGSDLGGFGLHWTTLRAGTYTENTIGLAYARPLSPTLHIGLGTALRTASIPAYPGTTGINLDLGLRYLPRPDLSLALLVRRTALSTEHSDVLGHALHTGVTYQPADNTWLSLEVHFREERPPSVRSGLRYQPGDRVSLLFGVVGSPGEASLGAGYRIGRRVELELGTAWHAVLGYSPLFAINYRNDGK